MAAKVPLLVPEVEPVPAAPAGPCGIPKLNTAEEVVPALVTVAALPAGRVVTEPRVTVAAVPAAPVGPAPPACASVAQAWVWVSGSAFWFAARAM